MLETDFNAKLLAFNRLGRLRLPVAALVSDRKSRDQLSTRRVTLRPANLLLELGSARQNQDGPLVSCLMVTCNRLRQAQLAVRSFQHHTWQRRELVVVDSGDDDRLARWIASLDDPAIRVVNKPGSKDSLGELRNTSVRAAAGTHICQWDDDDLFHPARVEAQLAVLMATKADACVLFRELMWMPGARRLLVTNRRPHENTLLCAKSIMPAFPSLSRGEDTPVVEALMNSRTVAFLDQPELYVYVFHGSNTWDSRHMESMWRASTRRFANGAYDAVLARLAPWFPIGEYKDILSTKAPASAMPHGPAGSR